MLAKALPPPFPPRPFVLQIKIQHPLISISSQVRPSLVTRLLRDKPHRVGGAVTMTTNTTSSSSAATIAVPRYVGYCCRRRPCPNGVAVYNTVANANLFFLLRRLWPRQSRCVCCQPFEAFPGSGCGSGGACLAPRGIKTRCPPMPCCGVVCRPDTAVAWRRLLICRWQNGCTTENEARKNTFLPIDFSGDFYRFSSQSRHTARQLASSISSSTSWVV